jgi:hypothetical protein
LPSDISARILKLCFPTWRWNHIPLKRKHYSVKVVSREKEVMFSLHLCEIVKFISLWKERGGLWHLCRLPKLSRRRRENNNLCGLCEIPWVLSQLKERNYLWYLCETPGVVATLAVGEEPADRLAIAGEVIAICRTYSTCVFILQAHIIVL